MARPETTRPVTAPAAASDVKDKPKTAPNEIAEEAATGPDQAEDQTQPQDSPMAAIVEMLARSDQGSEPPHALNPPVPMRYLSAFLLQSTIGQRPDQMEWKA